MEGWFGHKVWLPLVVTVTILFIVVFATTWLVSNTWADLLGLFYLMASPFIYGFLKSLLIESPGGSETGRDRLEVGNAGQ